MALPSHWKVFSNGYWLEPKARGSSPHVFCGTHDIPGARCYVGDHPMLRFASLDTDDDRLGLHLDGVRRLHLLYCWRCDLGDVDYRLTGDGVEMLGRVEWEAELAQKSKRERAEYLAMMRDPDTTYPYADYPHAFPERDATLRGLTRQQQTALIELDRKRGAKRPGLDHPRHQIGGLPYLVQGSDLVPSCEDCDSPMTFVAVFADDCADPRGFTDNDGVQVLFFLCAPCRRVHAFNICD